jgi:hypothetical protein
MTKNTQRATLFSHDGSINTGYFAEIGVARTSDWLRNRFLPETPESTTLTPFEEAPERLVITIITESGLGSEPAIFLGTAIASLLASSNKEPVSRCLPFLLSICEEIRIPQAEQWFFDKISLAAIDPGSFRSQYPIVDIQKQLISAGTIQVPAPMSDPMRAWWLKILKDSVWCTVALFGFGPSMEEQVPVLHEWWRSCPLVVRDRELLEIFRGYLHESRRQFLDVLRAVGAKWEKDMHDAANKALAALGDQPIFAITVSPEFADADIELTRLMADPASTSRIMRVSKKQPVKIIRSIYTHLGSLEQLHNAIFALLEQLGLQVTAIESSDFAQLVDPVLQGTERLVFTFPLYLTSSKRKNIFVLPYGAQTEIGAVIPRDSFLLADKPQHNALSAWDLESFLLRLSSHGDTKLFSPQNYSLDDIVHDTMINCDGCKPLKPICHIDAGNLRAATRLRSWIKKEAAKDGPRWVFLFDLGDRSVVEKAVRSIPPKHRPVVVTLPHRIHVPVGVGFNLYMLPWLQQGSHWSAIRAKVANMEDTIASDLKKIGITPLSESRLESHQLPRAVSQGQNLISINQK